MPDNDELTKHTKHKLLKARDRALGSAATIARDMPVDLYTIQYVFFGEEQHKILVSAQEKFDALKSANDTMDVLLEQHAHHIVSTPLAQTHHKFPSGPAAMARRHPSVSGIQKLSGSNDHNATSPPISPTNKPPNDPSSFRRRGHIPSAQDQNMSRSNEYNAMSLPRFRVNRDLPSEPTQTQRRYSSDTENESRSNRSHHHVNTLSLSNNSSNEASAARESIHPATRTDVHGRLHDRRRRWLHADK